MAVTPEGNLALIEELQELAGAKTYEPVDGPEFSFPAVGQAVDDEMWQWVTRAIGDGIIDIGDRPYYLSRFNNADNTAILTVGETSESAHSILGGFYHRLTKDMVLSFPMPLSETTYYVCLELNPLKAKTPEGPISIKVYPNEVNTESGRRHIVLHTVTRKPNQLLSEAKTEILRPRVSPLILVGSVGSLPDASSVLYGTVAIVEAQNDVMVAGNSDSDTGMPTEWISVLSPEWVDLADNNDYGWPGHGYHRGYRRMGSSVELRGRIERIDSAAFKSGGGDHDQGYRIMEIPQRLAPKYSMRFITATDGLANNKLAVISVEADGSVYGMPLLSNASWLGLDGVRFDAK